MILISVRRHISLASLKQKTVRYVCNGQSEKRHSIKLVSNSNKRDDFPFTRIKEPHRTFWNFHQNDRRFSDKEEGFSAHAIHYVCFLTAQLVLK